MKPIHITNSVVLFLKEETGLPVYAVYDGFEYPDHNVFVTVERVESTLEYNVKRREAVEVSNHYQIGLHTKFYNDREELQEELSNIFIFKNIPYIIDNEIIREFSCLLTSITPVSSESLNRESNRNRVYFDVEIKNIKRSC